MRLHIIWVELEISNIQIMAKKQGHLSRWHSFKYLRQLHWTPKVEIWREKHWRAFLGRPIRVQRTTHPVIQLVSSLFFQQMYKYRHGEMISCHLGWLATGAGIQLRWTLLIRDKGSIGMKNAFSYVESANLNYKTEFNLLQLKIFFRTGTVEKGMHSFNTSQKIITRSLEPIHSHS